MIPFLKKIFGLSPAVKYTELIQNGAIILDVRTKAEFASGHIQGAIHIPVAILASQLGQLQDKNKTIITCCASGMRSASAKSILKSNGFSSVYNGGSWSSLQSKM